MWNRKQLLEYNDNINKREFTTWLLVVGNPGLMGWPGDTDGQGPLITDPESYMELHWGRVRQSPSKADPAIIQRWVNEWMNGFFKTWVRRAGTSAWQAVQPTTNKWPFLGGHCVVKWSSKSSNPQSMVSWSGCTWLLGSMAPWLQKQPSPPTSGDKVKVKVRGRGSMWGGADISVIALAKSPVNTKHLYNICTMLDQRRRRWSDVVQILYKCFCVCWGTLCLPSKRKRLTTVSATLAQHQANTGLTCDVCWEEVDWWVNSSYHDNIWVPKPSHHSKYYQKLTLGYYHKTLTRNQPSDRPDTALQSQIAVTVHLISM